MKNIEFKIIISVPDGCEVKQVTTHQTNGERQGHSTSSREIETDKAIKSAFDFESEVARKDLVKAVRQRLGVKDGRAYKIILEYVEDGKLIKVDDQKLKLPEESGTPIPLQKGDAAALVVS